MCNFFNKKNPLKGGLEFRYNSYSFPGSTNLKSIYSGSITGLSLTKLRLSLLINTFSKTPALLFVFFTVASVFRVFLSRVCLAG